MMTTEQVEAAVALAILTLWAGAVFAWPAIRGLRAAGDTGFRRASGSRAGQWAMPLMVGGLTLVGLGCLVTALGYGLTPGAMTSPVRWVVAALGAVFALTGMVLAMVAQRQMRDSWRMGVDPAEQTTLVQHGLFKLTRNPFFSATMLVAWSFTAITWSPICAVGATAYTVGVNLQVRLLEEPALAVWHGQEHADYVARINRFLPTKTVRRG
jgi:protein-S-isoprenylcysteine O-methyltransferase Ste14